MALKPSRCLEWLRAVKDARGKARLVPILKAVFQLLAGPAPRPLWRRRMRACLKCPVFNHRSKTCHRGDLGCGCYMPFKAGVKSSGCWADQSLPAGTLPGWSKIRRAGK